MKERCAGIISSNRSERKSQSNVAAMTTIDAAAVAVERVAISLEPRGRRR